VGPACQDRLLPRAGVHCWNRTDSAQRNPRAPGRWATSAVLAPSVNRPTISAAHVDLARVVHRTTADLAACSDSEFGCRRGNNQAELAANYPAMACAPQRSPPIYKTVAWVSPPPHLIHRCPHQCVNPVAAIAASSKEPQLRLRPVLGLWSISVAWTEESLYDLQLLAAAPDWNDLLAAAATTPVNRRHSSWPARHIDLRPRYVPHSSSPSFPLGIAPVNFGFVAFGRRIACSPVVLRRWGGTAPASSVWFGGETPQPLDPGATSRIRS
jgi:hypothetical protein